MFTKTGPKRRRKTRRDGNEGVRKGLGCTRRSFRMDWFPAAGRGYGADGNVQRHPTANKIARQLPAEDGA